MGQTADQLRQELDRKRHDLTRDVDRIEEKVKSTFDLNSQVQQNPLLAAGLAVAGGFLLGNLVGGGSKSGGQSSQGYGGQTSGAYVPPATYTHRPDQGGQRYESGSSTSAFVPSATYTQRPEQGGPGLLEGVRESFRRGSGGSTVEDTVSNMTAAITAMLVDKAKEMMDRNLPGFAEKYEQAVNQSRSGSYRSAPSTLGTLGAASSSGTMGSPSTGSMGSTGGSAGGVGASTSGPSGGSETGGSGSTSGGVVSGGSGGQFTGGSQPGGGPGSSSNVSEGRQL